MGLDIDIVNGHGQSNETRHEFLPKKTKVMLYWPFIKALYQLYSTNKMEHFSFKSGHAIRVYQRARRRLANSVSDNFSFIQFYCYRTGTIKPNAFIN